MKKKMCAAWLSLFLLLCCALPAFAAPAVPEGMASLRVKVAYEGRPLPEVSVTLHRVADIVETSPWITFVLSDGFESYPVQLQELDHDGWAAAASTLAAYAAADHIAPDAVAKTDASGYASFKELRAGLYLMQTAQSTDEEGGRYTVAPVLLTLPAYDEAADQWNLQAEAVAKVERQDPPAETEIRVRKIWNSGSTQKPESITVELVADGESIATVELREENYWSHTFTGLEDGRSYRVVERNIPQGYTVTITQSGTQYLITNTAEDPTPPTEKPPEELPQTGVLRWPIPVLAGLGVVLFAVGWRMRRAGKDET